LHTDFFAKLVTTGFFYILHFLTYHEATMSPLKKALQQLSNEKEFYAEEFLLQPTYQLWKQAINANLADEFVALIQADVHNEERPEWLLKKQPTLVKAILHRDTLRQIRLWYQRHPSADFKRQRRQHAALVDTLYVLCARYKKQLRNLILKASNGSIGISLEENGLVAKETIPLTHAALPLRTSQTQKLKRALKHYQTTVKLEKILIGESSAQQKLYQFMHSFYEPATQEALYQHPSAGVMKLFKKLGVIFQFEQWLTAKRSTPEQSFPVDQNLLTELSQQVKKIAL
jgi:hypothetical protein